MMVCYLRKRPYKGWGKDKYLTLNEEYLVFEIAFYQEYTSDGSQKISVQIMCDDGSFRWFDLSYFDVTNAQVPDEWVFSYDVEEGIYFLKPKEFTDTFWDLIYKGDRRGYKVLERVLNKIQAFHSLELWEIQEPTQLKKIYIIILYYISKSFKIARRVYKRIKIFFLR